MSRPGRRPTAEHRYESAVYDHDNVTVDHAFHQSENGRVIIATALSTQSKQAAFSPTMLADAYATWTPFSAPPGPRTTDDSQAVPSLEEFEEEGATLFQANENVAEEATEAADDAGKKRKRYASSDDPNSIWRENAVKLLHELYRFDGLGDSLASPCCTTCGSALDTSQTAGRLFRCRDCHPLLECTPCLLERHETLPLHRIEEWNGEHFDSATLSAFGHVYQLGHGGLPCLAPDLTRRNMVVLHNNGVHNITYQYCDCTPIHKPSHVQQLMRAGWYPATTTDPRSCATFAVLDLYRELNVRATVNANNFFKVLVSKTNAINPDDVPERYRTFSRMARQWAFLHRLKRSGVGLGIKHLNDITPGSLAVLCWACPHIGINLQKDWEKLYSKYSYLFMPIVSVDANFRLKCRLRANEKSDPSLSPGSAYFIDPGPYKAFLKDYVSEKDVSTCIAFAALLEKDTKLTTGLKTSGVVGCACSRHEVIRPQGMGDLQKGERYANVDYVFCSAVKSYGLPDPASLHLTFGLPTWHAVAHALSCRTTHSLTYQDGVGRTDGEGIERIWSLLNPSSHATKEMGEGSRHDSLDDRIDHHNFQKNLSLGSVLTRRLQAAIETREEQLQSFLFHDKKLDESLRAKWLQQIADWKLDHTLPSPYLLTASSKGPSEEEIRAELEKDEKEEREASKQVFYGTSASAFLAAGLKLEDIQLKIRRDSANTNLTATEKEKLEERCDAFVDELKTFREHQRIYTPGAFRAMATDENAQPCPPLPNAEDVKLWLPSDFSSSERVTSCAPGLAYDEARLREGRCNDAIASVRHYLHAKQYLLAFRNANVTGQVQSTRARSVIDKTGAKADIEAEKYRRSRQALLSLYDVDVLDEYPELRASDVALDEITDADLLALVKLGNIGSKSHRRHHVPTGKKVLLWIWTAQGGPIEGAGHGLTDTVRVEWSKALARKDRWVEEVEQLREEMKRVLRFIDSRVAWWHSKMPAVNPSTIHHPAAATTSGIRAYAARQAALLQRIAARFQHQWGHD